MVLFCFFNQWVPKKYSLNWNVHVRCNLCYLSCLKHLIRTKAVTNRFIFQKRPFFFHACATSSELGKPQRKKSYFFFSVPVTKRERGGGKGLATKKAQKKSQKKPLSSGEGGKATKNYFFCGFHYHLM